MDHIFDNCSSLFQETLHAINSTRMEFCCELQEALGGADLELRQTDFRKVFTLVHLQYLPTSLAMTMRKRRLCSMPKAARSAEQEPEQSHEEESEEEEEARDSEVQELNSG